MIGRIRGTLVYKQPPDILVDVSGVGYDVQVPMSTLFQLPELGAEVTLLTILSSGRMRSFYTALLTSATGPCSDNW